MKHMTWTGAIFAFLATWGCVQETQSADDDEGSKNSGGAQTVASSAHAGGATSTTSTQGSGGADGCGNSVCDVGESSSCADCAAEGQPCDSQSACPAGLMCAAAAWNAELGTYEGGVCSKRCREPSECGLDQKCCQTQPDLQHQVCFDPAVFENNPNWGCGYDSSFYD